MNKKAKSLGLGLELLELKLSPSTVAAVAPVAAEYATTSVTTDDDPPVYPCDPYEDPLPCPEPPPPTPPECPITTEPTFPPTSPVGPA